MKWQQWFSEPNECPVGWGVYRVRMVDIHGKAIRLQRLCGIDKDGILYIGRSGRKASKTNRCLKTRIAEFRNPNSHSGGWTYHKAREARNGRGVFRHHKIQFQVSICQKDSEIDAREKEALKDYFDTYGELPPFNSAFPGK